MWPRDGARQIEVLRWLFWDIAHFSRHAGALLFENHIKGVFDMGVPDRAVIEEATGFFRHFAGVLDGHLAGRDHVANDTLSVADFALASMLPTAAEARLPLDDFPEVCHWHEGLMQLPAWRAPFPVARSAVA